MSTEFVIEQSQRNAVEGNKGRIEELFNVQISFANGTTGKLWITLNGGQLEKAQSYVQALASPEVRRDVPIPASLIKLIGPRTKEHFKLESEYGVVVQFPNNMTTSIAGSQMDVTLAESYLDELIKKLSNAPKPKPRTKVPEQKPNRALADFALKLGYEQQQIDNVFEKLGPTVDQNTFLNALINISGAHTKVPDDRCLPPPRPTSAARSNQAEPWHTNKPYGQDLIVARGTIPRTTASTSSIPNLGNGNPYTPRPTSRGSAPTTQTYTAYPDSVNPNDIISRGMILPPRTTAQTTQGNNTTYSGMDRITNNFYDQYNMMYGDPQGSQVDQLLEQLLTTKYQQHTQSDLRHIVIDGSNVAMSHGNNKVFSCRGIALCVDWFRKRGHNEITVFVPTWRKESPKIDNPITDQHILNQLEAQKCLTFTPSRRVKGRRVVCYDDRFIIKLAVATDGIIVSNDNFKDLAMENPKWRDVIEQRLLMYSFVNDMFMPPDDPLGRHGPTLDELLHKGSPAHRRVCPYGRRCTYGMRCKYHHPEREDQRLQIYQSLKQLFPSQDALIVNVMKKYPQEKDADKLATHILNMIH